VYKKNKIFAKVLEVLLACSIILVGGFSTQAQAINWKQCQGETISVLLCRHGYTDALVSLLPRFEKKTGIKVKYNVLPTEQIYEKSLIRMSAQDPSLDVLMSGYYSEWVFGYRGWLEPLDKYLNDPMLTDEKNYDFGDFFPSLIKAHRWDCIFGHKEGTGPLWGIPIQAEVANLIYNKEILNKFGISVPTTYPELYQAAKKATRKIEGQQLYGIVECQARTFDIFDNSFDTVFFTYGAKDFDTKGNCRLDSEVSVKVHKFYNDMLRECSTPDVINYTVYDEMDQFATGRYAFIIAPNVLGPFMFELPEKSQIADTVDYTAPPRGPAGDISSHMFSWSVSMNKASKHKKAAWLFIQWTTSKEFVLESAIKADNWMPVRKSAFNDPRVQARGKEWGHYLPVAVDMFTNYAAVQKTPNPKWFAVGDRWAQAMQEILLQTKTAQKALSDATKDINTLLKAIKVK